jgi:phytoene dehydrogenase-like protein
MTRTVDAVVIGSGVNGMVAAAELAKSGWSVALVEQAGDLGGFIATEERTVPGYLHDTYSSFHPLFVSGGAYPALGDLPAVARGRQISRSEPSRPRPRRPLEPEP